MADILTDGVHLVCRDRTKLHGFARHIGLRREWFQDGRHPHYDLTTVRKRQQAIEAGAKMATARQVERECRHA